MGTLVNGIKEIFATSQSTATHVPVCASDGTPQGRISVGDLASVLGGLPYKIGIGVSDLDTLFTNGCYYIGDSGTLNLGTASVMVFKWANGNDNYCQIASSIQGTVMKIRYYSNSQWLPWQTIERNIPAFYKNYSTLENLAKAVNGLITLDVPQSLDADDILYTGVYQTNLLSNIPIEGGHLLICIRGNTDYVAQILIKVSGSPDVYIRSRVDRSGWSWTDWNRLSMSVV